MFSVQYIAKDNNTKEKVRSCIYYFNEASKYNLDNIEANRKFIEETLGNHVVVAIIKDVEENK
jgi:hypothetical protein